MSENKTTITKDILIADLANQYPDVVQMLITEYGFHCVGCIVSGFETLEQGAMVHGIIEDEFDEMLTDINKMINQSQS